ncbi:transmembrane protein 106A isoform X2 [Cynoglossus semilaevis]|uniref:transmembrane protein 106A isoform X2 n=1 Tax=Cynoglossus semilaevis TaxID=244447 RepID=UPI000D629BD5|nr:transmembrane protein 106B isoform X2 [Cynoglossus semilaevis]
MYTTDEEGPIIEAPDVTNGTERQRTLKQFPPYGSVNGNSKGDICPTCRGSGRIPRGHEDELVAVIPCNDVRLKPRRTKLYVSSIVAVCICLCICCLILFFLFPRSVSLTPVSVLSVMVYFTPDTVDLEVTNLINVTNKNFVPVQIIDFTVQGLVTDILLGKTKISNMTGIQPRTENAGYKIPAKLSISDTGLKMTMNISYLSHMEQVSMTTFEYIDCGTNSTTPRPITSALRYMES